MKFSMEKMYVPVASNDEKREMMSDWRQTSGRVRNWSLICAVAAGFFAAILGTYGDELFVVFAATMVVLLLSAVLVHKWFLSGYTCVIVATVLGFTRLLVPLSDEFFLAAAVIAGVFLPLVPCFFAFRCIYNYNEVFLELKKFKEFPEFIQNTADLYGEKIYLKDEDNNHFDDKFQAAYNPFNTQRDVYREEFLRQQESKANKRLGKRVMDIDVDKDNVRSTPDVKRYRTVFGYEWKMCHCNLLTASPDERKAVADKWRENYMLAEKGFGFTVILMAFCVMAGSFGSLAGMLNYLAIVVFISGITYMKLSNPVAPLIALGSLIYIGILASANSIGLCLFAGVLLSCRWLFLSIIRFYANYGTYKQLKGLPGFPSFISTTTDLYGDKLYITEKPVAPIKKVNGQNKIVMNIGFDEPQKKEDKAWNAFDYMEENDKENKDD